MEPQQLIVSERQGNIRPPPVIAEFNLAHAGCEQFDDSPNLTASKRMVRDVLQWGDHRKQCEFTHIDQCQ